MVKPSFGYGGAAVERLGPDAEDSVLHEMLRKHRQLLVQEYIPHPRGDFRVTTCSGHVLFAGRRVPNEKTWKANVSLGADMVILDDAPEEVRLLGLRAANLLKLFLSGVDILPYRDSYVVLEVNNCPGWSSIPQFLQHEVAAQVVKAALAKAAPRRSQLHTQIKLNSAIRE